MKDAYLNLVDFWNKSFTLTEEDKKQLQEEVGPRDYKSLAPSPKLFEALKDFEDKQNVLDYGAGSGWASIIMAKCGASRVLAVDVAENSIEMINCYKQAFEVEDKIDTLFINEKWLEKQEEESFDGFFCSNVIDVIPLEMAKEIIKNSAKVVKDDARVVFSLNYYADPEAMKERGFEVDGASVYIEGVLRLTSLKDEEWIAIFKKYYKEVEVSYFAWPGEEKETRRLFVLKK